MLGWTGNILRVNLTDEDLQEGVLQRGIRQNMGRRARLRRQDPLTTSSSRGSTPWARRTSSSSPWGRSPASRPPTPGKAVVAAKSPLTGFYGDGNLGTRVTEHLRKAGYDALIVEGKADRPTLLLHRGRQGRVPPGRRGLGQGNLRDERLDLRQVRQGRRRPEHRPGRREHGPLRRRPQPGGAGRRPAGHRRRHGLQAPQGHRRQGHQAHPPGRSRRR